MDTQDLSHMRESLSKDSDATKGFFGHVFEYNDETKVTLLNILQYILVAFIPIVILIKTMQTYVPDADDNKSSLELFVEIFVQLAFIFVGIFLIHRIITYIPTQSGEAYPKMDITSIILSTLVIILSLKSKLGDKVTILWERVVGESTYHHHPPATPDQQQPPQQVTMPPPTNVARSNTANPAPQPVVTNTLRAANEFF